jgi:hypothetical protein
LFLGASESVGDFTDLFELAANQKKIDCKRAAPMSPFQLLESGTAFAAMPIQAQPV